ncbi:zinc finger CW-type PWWP domain protein 1-like [Anoplophora glabripennis]|uniref:zinc finger CW-type PWWP domain protein 1-like n=1 Tax=Anoplophora glabripennis TaxID=217634 RepID=UPI0008755F46|nr:zinc finger CW-type PWWP domain protein 1-like [Anoplophora glabripennis]
MYYETDKKEFSDLSEMPLLKKSSKGNLSQHKNAFKIPYADLTKVKNIIGNKINEPEIKIVNRAFANRLSQEKNENWSSSPKEICSQTDENRENSQEKENTATKKKNKSEHGNKMRTLSFETESSVSQEVLNKDEIKTAYVEFMNNSLADKKNKKKRAIIYSSSEELFDIVEGFQTDNLKIHPKEVTEKKNKKETEKKSRTKNIPKSRNPSNEQIEVSMSGTKNKKNSREKTNRTAKKGKKDESEQTSKIRRLSFDTEGSFSQEILNSAEIKAAYVDFMKNSLVDKKKGKIIKHSDKEIEESLSDNEFPGLTVEEKINKIYEKRNVGLYVLCDTCNKARYLPHVIDPLDLPETWFCYMNPDEKHNKCSDPEHVEENRDFLIDNLYNAGSIVFVKMDGYPWWPAMVEDDVDTETYFWLEGNSMSPTFYHVTFFDSTGVTRAWIKTEKIQPFTKNLKRPEFQLPAKHQYKSRMNMAMKQAMDAADMPLIDRLKTYGFLKRYRKPVKRNKNTKNKEILDEKRREVSPFVEDMSVLLDSINMSDISFNLLD